METNIVYLWKIFYTSSYSGSRIKRLRILKYLVDHYNSQYVVVSKISSSLNMSKQLIWYHLRYLEKLGLVEIHRSRTGSLVRITKLGITLLAYHSVKNSSQFHVDPPLKYECPIYSSNSTASYGNLKIILTFQEMGRGEKHIQGELGFRFKRKSVKNLIDLKHFKRIMCYYNSKSKSIHLDICSKFRDREEMIDFSLSYVQLRLVELLKLTLLCLKSLGYNLSDINEIFKSLPNSKLYVNL